MNKKGNVALEVTLVLVLLISFIVAFPVIYSQLSPVITSLTSDTSFSDEATSGLSNFNDRLPRMLDNIFLMILILFWVGGAMLAYFVDTHPMFFGFSLILIIVVLYASVFLGDFAEKFMNTDAVSLARENMPIITFVSSHILEFMMAIAFTMLLALFGRTNRGGAI